MKSPAFVRALDGDGLRLRNRASAIGELAVRELRSPSGAPNEFAATIEWWQGEQEIECALELTGEDPVTGRRTTHRYRLPTHDHDLFVDLLTRLAHDFGVRVPFNRLPKAESTFDDVEAHVLLADSLSAKILYGYGDPAVLRVEGKDIGEDGAWYYAVLTSNDAPDSFPVIRSDDLRRWELVGFAFPDGHKPPWAVDGENVADYWAPELHKVGDEFWLVFVARHALTRELCIGVAKSARPDGPFLAAEEPLLRGGRIDPHLLVERDEPVLLYWKEDRNDIWRNALNALLFEHPRLIRPLFLSEADRRMASLVAALWPWTRELEPMERFVHQVLIEAVTSDLFAFELRLNAVLEEPQIRADLVLCRKIETVRDALKTPIFVQELAPSGLHLLGQPTKVLENDQPWEAHVIEGVWVVAHEGKYHMFYAGNDFSTAEYGIGAAVADSPLGPFHKLSGALLRTTRRWLGPGHPSVAIGPAGEHVLFYHAFAPGETGYKRFRAFLAVGLGFEDGVPVLDPSLRIGRVA